MSTATDYATQAELALAAYSQLSSAMTTTEYLAALRDSGQGMTADQAIHFASTYTVVEQYNVPSNGLSVIGVSFGFNLN